MTGAVQGSLSNHGTIRCSADFRRIYDTGRSIRSADLVLVFVRTGSGSRRHAVVASRRVGNAVRRNRSKRLLREAHRTLERTGLVPGAEMVLIARAGLPARTIHQVLQQATQIYREAGLLDPERAHPAGAGHSGETGNS